MRIVETQASQGEGSVAYRERVMSCFGCKSLPKAMVQVDTLVLITDGHLRAFRVEEKRQAVLNETVPYYRQAMWAFVLIRGLHSYQPNRRLRLGLCRVSSRTGRLISVCRELESSPHELSVLTVVTLNLGMLERLQPNEPTYPFPSPANFVLRVRSEEGIEVVLGKPHSVIGDGKTIDISIYLNARQNRGTTLYDNVNAR